MALYRSQTQQCYSHLDFLVVMVESLMMVMEFSKEGGFAGGHQRISQDAHNPIGSLWVHVHSGPEVGGKSEGCDESWIIFHHVIGHVMRWVADPASWNNQPNNQAAFLRLIDFPFEYIFSVLIAAVGCLHFVREMPKASQVATYLT
jgi:hypothetical protein